MRPPNRVARHARYDEALRRLNSVSPVEEWPYAVRSLFFGTATIVHGERIRLSAFLFGNGARSEDVLPLVWHRLRDEPARTDIRRAVADMNNPLTSGRFFYYDVNAKDTLHLDGRLREGKQMGARALNRMIHTWSKYAYRHRATLHMQRRFFSQRDVLDANVFFGLDLE